MQQKKTAWEISDVNIARLMKTIVYLPCPGEEMYS